MPYEVQYNLLITYLSNAMLFPERHSCVTISMILFRHYQDNDNFPESTLLSYLYLPGALVQVYTQERREDIGLYAEGLPALKGFTIHMWFYGIPDDDDRKMDWMINIAVPGLLKPQA